jgi:hypothetical protein
VQPEAVFLGNVDYVFMAEGEDLDNSLEFSDIVLLVWDTCKYGKEATL